MRKFLTNFAACILTLAFLTCLYMAFFVHADAADKIELYGDKQKVYNLYEDNCETEEEEDYIKDFLDRSDVEYSAEVSSKSYTGSYVTTTVYSISVTFDKITNEDFSIDIPLMEDVFELTNYTDNDGQFRFDKHWSDVESHSSGIQSKGDYIEPSIDTVEPDDDYRAPEPSYDPDEVPISSGMFSLKDETQVIWVDDDCGGYPELDIKLTEYWAVHEIDEPYRYMYHSWVDKSGNGYVASNDLTLKIDGNSTVDEIIMKKGADAIVDVTGNGNFVLISLSDGSVAFGTIAGNNNIVVIDGGEWTAIDISGNNNIVFKQSPGEWCVSGKGNIVEVEEGVGNANGSSTYSYDDSNIIEETDNMPDAWDNYGVTAAIEETNEAVENGDLVPTITVVGSTPTPTITDVAPAPAAADANGE